MIFEMNTLFFVNKYNSSNPSGICTKRIVDELSKQNNRVLVLTQKLTNEQSFEEKYDNVEIYNIKKSFIDYSKLTKKNASTNKINFFFSCCKNLIIAFIYSWVWPLSDPILAYRYYRKAIKLYKEKPFDAAVSVYLGMNELYAGILLKRKLPNIRLLIYTLDALTGRKVPYNKYFNKIYKKSIQRWEQKAFNVADVICAMASHKSHYENKYYDNIRHKIEYMDIPLLTPTNINKIVINKYYYEKINKKIAVFTGLMTSYSGNPIYFLNILKNIDNLEFHVFGTINEDLLKQIESTDLMNKKMFFHGRVPYNEIIEIQLQADFLLSFGCTNPNMVPCKIFEYISLGKPIINFYRISDDAAFPYLNDYPISLQIFEDVNKLSVNTLKLMEFLRRTDYKTIESSFLIERYYNNTPYPMVNIIKNEKVL